MSTASSRLHLRRHLRLISSTFPPPVFAPHRGAPVAARLGLRGWVLLGMFVRYSHVPRQNVELKACPRKRRKDNDEAGALLSLPRLHHLAFHSQPAGPSPTEWTPFCCSASHGICFLRAAQASWASCECGGRSRLRRRLLASVLFDYAWRGSASCISQSGPVARSGWPPKLQPHYLTERASTGRRE